MAVRDEIPSNYWQADTTLGKRDSRVIGYATSLARQYGTDGRIGLVHHGTVIVTYDQSGWVEITNDYGSVTTTARIRAALPGSWNIGSRNGARYLWHGGYALTPLVDGLAVAADWMDDGTLAPDAPVVTYRGDTILTAADVAAIKSAEDDARAARDAKRQARLLREHPTVGGPRTHTASAWDRRARDCERCHEEERLEREAHRAAVSAEHDAGSHADRCPWDCSQRPATQGWWY